MDETRIQLISAGLAELGQCALSSASGRNGEALAHDEAAVWKRVLNLRVAKHIRPSKVFETHPGLNISTELYRKAAPTAEVRCHSNGNECFDLIDIDPFGQPWDFMHEHSACLQLCRFAMITNGEALAVRRNLTKAQRYPTKNFGKRMPVWVTSELIPRMENMTNKRCVFFYAFPTSVRVFLSNENIPESLWEGCPNWMWWLKKYA